MVDSVFEPTERVSASKFMDYSDPCALKVRESAEDERNRGGKEEKALLFLDSMDDYLTLLDSLSSTLRQGWLELASARQSMGSSRVSSTLLDLKIYSAETTLQLSELADGSPLASQPHFTLSKWASFKQNKEVRDEGFCTNSESTRYRGKKQLPESTQETSSASIEATKVNEQRQRHKSLTVFGALVSPKLRAAQVSFEKALETIVDIANVRSSMLSSFTELQQITECSK